MPRMVMKRAASRIWQVLVKTVRIFGEIDAEQRAAAFAYYAVFSLIPLLALLFSIGSMFFAADTVKHTVAEFIPPGSPGQDQIWAMVDELQRARGGVSILSLIILAWSSLKFFQALVRAVNRPTKSVSIVSVDEAKRSPKAPPARDSRTLSVRS